MQHLKVLLYTDGLHGEHKGGIALKYFDPILNSLKNNFDVKEIWVTANGGVSSKKYDENTMFYNIFSFNNSNEVLDGLNPDVLIIPNSQEYLSRSLLFAAKFNKIPSVIIYRGIPQFIKKSVPSTIFIRLVSFPMYGKMFLKKYNFLIRTLFDAGYNLFFIMKIILKDIYYLSSSFVSEFKSDDADLYILSNNEWLDYAVRRGIKREKLVVVGECAMDDIYNRIPQLRPVKNNKIEILFVTSPAVEHAIWRPHMRNKLVIDVISAIKDQLHDVANLRIKIHPTSERFEDYSRIVSPIDPSIQIIQEGDLLSLINESDLIITFGQSTALFQVILLKKPLIIMNPYNESLFYLQEKVALECKTADDLINKIESREYSKIDTDRIKAFVERLTYKFDGKCSERAAEHIVSLLQKRN